MSRDRVGRASLTAAALSGFGMLFSTGPIVFATFSLFMLPMSKAFGWGRGEMSAALVICSGCAAVADPVVGRLVDRWGARRVLLPGLAAFAAANAALSLAGPSLPVFYGLFALVGVSSACCAAVPYSKVLSSWFARRRGLALGVSLGVGAGLGAALMPQLVRLMIDALGWRAAHLGLGAVIAFAGLPVVALFLRERDGPGGRAAGASPAGVSAAQARRDPTLWLVFVMILMGTAALAGTSIHMVAMLHDRGLSTATGTAIYSSYAVANIAGHVIVGLLQDRIASPKVGALVYASALAGLVILSGGGGLPMVWTGAVFLGLGFGAEVSLGAYWTARYWGLRCYGEIYGVLYCAASAGVAVGPVLMGLIYDRTGSYGAVMVGFQLAVAACLALTLALKPYPDAAPELPLALDGAVPDPRRAA